MSLRSSYAVCLLVEIVEDVLLSPCEFPRGTFRNSGDASSNTSSESDSRRISVKADFTKI